MTLALAGCSSVDRYADNRDAVTFQAGDAVAANKVAQMIDPWPAEVSNTRLETSGQRARAALVRYRAGLVQPPVPATADQALPEPVPPPPDADGPAGPAAEQ